MLLNGSGLIASHIIFIVVYCAERQTDRHTDTHRQSDKTDIHTRREELGVPTKRFLRKLTILQGSHVIHALF